MGSISVSVPEDMRRFVEDLVARAGFGMPSEDMRHLIREDRKRVAQQQACAKSSRPSRNSQPAVGA